VSSIGIEIVSRVPALAQYRDAWDAIYDASGREPSTSFEWCDALTRSHVEAGDRFLLLQVTRGTEVTGFLPLVARRVKVLGCPANLLTPLSDLYNTHGDVLTREMNGETMTAIVSALVRIDEPWDVFRMANVLEGHPLVSSVEGYARDPRAMRHVRAGYGSYFLPLPGSFDEYLSGRSAKFRNHLKRCGTKLESRGDVRVVDCSAPADVPAAFDRLLAIERASWKHAHGTAISAVPRQARFYRDLCDGAAARGRLHLQVLTIDGEGVAYNLGYLANGHYAYLKTSYDERCKPLGVATYLRARTIASLIEHGVTDVDFPAEPYEWERQWTDTVRWHRVVTLYRSTVVGTALGCIERLRPRRRAATQIEHVDPRALDAARQMSAQ
jgi:CelD/BcsL family acetyltransferase involved in cellulose biosynthesis